MKARQFIDIVGVAQNKKKLKIVDKDGNWCDVGLDEEMPLEIYGYAIYTMAEFPSSISELKESGLIANVN